MVKTIAATAGAAVDGQPFAHDGQNGLDLTWNLLNLVSGAVMHGSDNHTDDSSLTYAWLSDGTKVSAVADDGSGNGVQKRYLGSFVYTSTGGSSAEPPMEVESVAWDEGGSSSICQRSRIQWEGLISPVGEEAVIDSLIVVDTAAVAGWFRDCWYAADHLGNVRAVIDINPELVAPEILEQNDYLPYGTRIQNPAFATATDNRWRYAGKEEQRFAFGSAPGSLNLSLLDFGARMYDPFSARWTAVDPMAENLFGFTPYNYCANDPMSIIDANGLWGVKVHLYSNRNEYGYGIAIVYNSAGEEQYRFTVRAEGTGGRDRMKRNSDTPLGTYNIPEDNPWLFGGSRAAYGSNPRLNMEPESGEITASGRNAIRIHGGRQESYDNDSGTWVVNDNPQLKKTHGCLRAFDSDMVAFKEITDNLEKSNPNETPTSVVISDDLQKVTRPSSSKNYVEIQIAYELLEKKEFVLPLEWKR